MRSGGATDSPEQYSKQLIHGDYLQHSTCGCDEAYERPSKGTSGAPDALLKMNNGSLRTEVFIVRVGGVVRRWKGEIKRLTACFFLLLQLIYFSLRWKCSALRLVYNSHAREPHSSHPGKVPQRRQYDKYLFRTQRRVFRNNDKNLFFSWKPRM